MKEDQKEKLLKLLHRTFKEKNVDTAISCDEISTHTHTKWEKKSKKKENWVYQLSISEKKYLLWRSEICGA